MHTPNRGFPHVLDSSQSNSNGHQRVLTAQEKQERYEQHLKEYQAFASSDSDYLADNPLSPAASYPYHEQPFGSESSSAGNRERPLTREEQQEKFAKHLQEYSALSLEDTETNNRERPLTREEQQEKFAEHLREHSALQLADADHGKQDEVTFHQSLPLAPVVPEPPPIPLPPPPVSPYYAPAVPATFMPNQQYSSFVPGHFGLPLPAQPLAFSTLSPAVNPHFHPSFRSDVPPVLLLPPQPPVSPYDMPAHFQPLPVPSPMPSQPPMVLPYSPAAYNPASGPTIIDHQQSTVASFPVSPLGSLPVSSSSSYSSILPVLQRSDSPPAADLSDEQIARMLADEEEEGARSLPSESQRVRPTTTPTMIQNTQLTGKDICRNNIDASQLKEYAELEKIWTEASHKSLILRIRSILSNYTGGNKPLIRFVRGNWNRSNLAEVQPIITYINKLHGSVSSDALSNDLSEQVLERLYAIPLDNPKGTLATIIQFLTQKMHPIPQREHRFGYS